MEKKLKLCWVGDAVAMTGFSRVTHSILDRLHATGRYDIAVFGLNFYGFEGGDGPSYPYKIVPTKNVISGATLKKFYEEEKPDVIVHVNDPWVASQFVKWHQHLPPETKTFVYTPVDAPNVPENHVTPLNGFTQVITYTDFGARELLLAGLQHQPAVIPHGVDTNHFFPLDKALVRRQVFKWSEDEYIVGMVARNQPRKRQDIAIRAFSKWVKDKPKNVKLYLHCCLADAGWDILQLARYYGVEDRLILTSTEMNPAQGVPISTLNNIYNCMDVHLNTSLGEGWGLPVAESMATGTPQIVGDWSALGEWPGDAVHRVPVTGFYHALKINTLGGVIDERLLIDALELHYKNPEYRRTMGLRALAKVREPKFSWDTIAGQFDASFTSEYSQRQWQLDLIRKQFAEAEKAKEQPVEEPEEGE